MSEEHSDPPDEAGGAVRVGKTPKEPPAGTKAAEVLRLVRLGGRNAREISVLAGTTISTTRQYISSFRKRGINLGDWVFSDVSPDTHKVAPRTELSVPVSEKTLSSLRGAAKDRCVSPEGLAMIILRCVAEDDLYTAVTEK